MKKTNLQIPGILVIVVLMAGVVLAENPFDVVETIEPDGDEETPFEDPRTSIPSFQGGFSGGGFIPALIMVLIVLMILFIVFVIVPLFRKEKQKSL